MDLAKQICIPCQEGAAKLTEMDLADLLPQLPGWEVVDHHHLARCDSSTSRVLSIG